MDRFAWTDGLLGGEENLVHEQTGVRIYDGDQKVGLCLRASRNLF